MVETRSIAHSRQMLNALQEHYCGAITLLGSGQVLGDDTGDDSGAVTSNDEDDQVDEEKDCMRLRVATGRSRRRSREPSITEIKLY